MLLATLNSMVLGGIQKELERGITHVGILYHLLSDLRGDQLAAEVAWKEEQRCWGCSSCEDIDRSLRSLNTKDTEETEDTKNNSSQVSLASYPLCPLYPLCPWVIC